MLGVVLASRISLSVSDSQPSWCWDLWLRESSCALGKGCLYFSHLDFYANGELNTVQYCCFFIKHHLSQCFTNVPLHLLLIGFIKGCGPIHGAREERWGLQAEMGSLGRNQLLEICQLDMEEGTGVRTEGEDMSHTTEHRLEWTS